MVFSSRHSLTEGSHPQRGLTGIFSFPCDNLLWFSDDKFPRRKKVKVENEFCSLPNRLAIAKVTGLAGGQQGGRREVLVMCPDPASRDRPGLATQEWGNLGEQWLNRGLAGRRPGLPRPGSEHQEGSLLSWGARAGRATLVADTLLTPCLHLS